MAALHINEERIMARISPVPSPNETSEKALAKMQKMRVLVIDDHFFARALLRNVLQALGVWRVAESISAMEGMARLAEEDFDLVLVDNQMPKVSGTAFTKAVRRSSTVKNQAVPIIMVSSHTDIDQIKDAIESGIHDFLAKPFSAVGLAKRLHTCLNNQRFFVRADTYVGPCRRISGRKLRMGAVERRSKLQ